MRHCLMVLFIFMLGCGPIHEFYLGEQEFIMGNYQKSVQHLQAGLDREPQNSYYRSLKFVAQKRVAQKLYQEALELLENKDSNAAEQKLEKVLLYEPEHLGAQSKLATIRRNKAQVKKTLQHAQTAMNNKKWDVAYQSLQNILAYQKDFKEISSAHKRSRDKSFAYHFANGKKLFSEEKYALAEKEFKIALTRISDSQDCLRWKNRSSYYLQAQQLTREARQSYNRGLVKKAYQQYLQALTIVTNFRNAIYGRNQAKQELLTQMYGKAIGLAQLGKKQKRQAFAALKVFKEIQQLSPDYKNTQQQLAEIKRVCAIHLLQQARVYLWQADFSRIALAYYLLKYAQTLSTNLPILPKMLATCQHLAKLKIHAHIILTTTKSKDRPLNEKLQQHLQHLKKQGYKFSCGTIEQHRLRLYKRVRDILKGTGQNYQNFPVRILHLQINEYTKHIEQKRSAVKKISSSYFQGLKTEKDTKRELLENEMILAKSTWQRLFPIYCDILQQKETAYLTLTERQNYIHATNHKAKLYSTLLQQSKNWQDELRDYQICEEIEKFNTLLQKDIAALESQASQQRHDCYSYQSQHNSLQRKLSTLYKKIRTEEQRIERCQEYIDSTTIEKKIANWQLYDFYKGHLSMTATAKICVRLGDSSDKILQNFTVTADKLYFTPIIDGARYWDREGHYNIESSVPAKQMLRREIENKLLAKLYRKLAHFLNDLPLTIYNQAINNNSIDGLERLVMYIELDNGSHPHEYAQANAKLQEFVRGELEIKDE